MTEEFDRMWELLTDEQKDDMRQFAKSLANFMVNTAIPKFRKAGWPSKHAID